MWRMVPTGDACPSSGIVAVVGGDDRGPLYEALEKSRGRSLRAKGSGSREIGALGTLATLWGGFLRRDVILVFKHRFLRL